MSQANAINTSNARPISMLDAINPNRAIFSPKPRSATSLLIDKLAADLGRNGPVFPEVPREPRNPYATSWGKVTDQPKYTAWEIARVANRRESI